MTAPSSAHGPARAEHTGRHRNPTAVGSTHGKERRCAQTGQRSSAGWRCGAKDIRDRRCAMDAIHEVDRPTSAAQARPREALREAQRLPPDLAKPSAVGRLNPPSPVWDFPKSFPTASKVPANRHKSTSSTSWGSLVRAQYRPSKDLQTSRLRCQPRRRRFLRGNAWRIDSSGLPSAPESVVRRVATSDCSLPFAAVRFKLEGLNPSGHRLRAVPPLGGAGKCLGEHACEMRGPKTCGSRLYVDAGPLQRWESVGAALPDVERTRRRCGGHGIKSGLTS